MGRMPAYQQPLDGLAHIDENLIRKELSTAERGRGGSSPCPSSSSLSLHEVANARLVPWRHRTKHVVCRELSSPKFSTSACRPTHPQRIPANATAMFGAEVEMKKLRVGAMLTGAEAAYVRAAVEEFGCSRATVIRDALRVVADIEAEHRARAAGASWEVVREDGGRGH